MNFTDIDRKTVFFDTNVLVYTIDGKDERKQQLARELLERATSKATPVISTQVLMELYSVLTTKLKLDRIDARLFVEQLSNMHVVTADTALVKRAIDTSILARLSFWDALIVSAAEHANCSMLLTEDLANGQTLNGIKVVNPFE
jgi:predicted nucleic acid-binding protein